MEKEIPHSTFLLRTALAPNKSFAEVVKREMRQPMYICGAIILCLAKNPYRSDHYVALLVPSAAFAKVARNPSLLVGLRMLMHKGSFEG